MGAAPVGSLSTYTRRRRHVAGAAVPDAPPVVAWDVNRGVFLVGLDHPEWKGVRATYDQLVFRAPPIVAWGDPAWLIGLRRLVAGARR